MINRTLIRIKVVQMVYSYVLTKDETTLKDALKQLAKSFDKSYELYNYLLLLIVELADLQDRRLDDAKNKYLPTEEDLNPNTRFIDNRLAAMLREDKMLNDYVSENKITWKNDDVFMKLLLDKILHSDVYEKYIEIDGLNEAINAENNLELLCPNCHSLTENFGSRNKNATEGRSKYYGKSKG